MSDRPQGEPEQAKMWSAFLKDDPNGLTVLLSFVRLRAVFESGELFNPDGATLRNREEGMNAFFELGMDLKSQPSHGLRKKVLD